MAVCAVYLAYSLARELLANFFSSARAAWMYMKQAPKKHTQPRYLSPPMAPAAKLTR